MVVSVDTENCFALGDPTRQTPGRSFHLHCVYRRFVAPDSFV